MKRIAILHYTGPPTIGGVESTIAYQARGLADLGYRVRLVSGAAAAFDERVEVVTNPLFGSTHPEVLAVKAELDSGRVTPAFNTLVERLEGDLRAALADSDVCLAHNLPTLHKSLSLTAALARVMKADSPRLIAWCHDLAWLNRQYQSELHQGYPWDLLRQPWPGARYVTVSEMRRAELADLLQIPLESVAAVVPGIDPARFLRWTATTGDLASRLKLLDADGLLLLPARITRRKNIELALSVLAEVRAQSGADFRLIVTGPPGPHNPANRGYLGELLDQRAALGLEDFAHFLYAFGPSPDEPLIPDDDTLADLYRLADALLFPSLSEGFGIPILEAGLTGLPIFCADIPPLRETGQNNPTYFDPVNDPPERIAACILETLEASPTYRLRVRARQSYRWEVLIRRQLVPLLEAV